MRSAKQIRHPRVAQAPGALPPQTPNAFKHTLDHHCSAYAGALEAAEKQRRYALPAHPSTSKPVTPKMLALAQKQCERSIRESFVQQNKARMTLAKNRHQWVNKLPGQASSRQLHLQSFKAQESVLPWPEGAEGLALHSACCEEADLAGAGAKKHSPSGCSHEEGGGIVVDLDEAAHGAFALTKHLKDVAQGNPEKVIQSFEQAADDWARAPTQYLGQELTQSGVAEFASSVGAAGLLLPLAGLAVHAGIEEWQHGNHQLEELNTLLEAQTKEHRTLIAAAQMLPGKPMQARIQAQEIRLEKTQQAKEEAQKTKQIGLASAASGLSIGLKASSDIALKTSLGIKGAATGQGFFALNESAQVGTAAAGAAVGLGVAGTLILGPAAGIFATALGALFTQKTLTKLHQLRGDFEILKSELRAHAMARAHRADPQAIALQHFLIRQGNKRIGFFQQFSRWNKAFMVGSGLYASSAATKAVVAGLAIGGLAAAASNPIGLAMISAVGIVGSVAMGIASLSFFRGHGKQSKYSNATAADHAWVDRKLMTDLHGLGPMVHRLPTLEAVLDGEAWPPDHHPGFDMAAACLTYLDTTKGALKEFMAEAAATAKKHSPMEKNITWWQQLGGQVAKPKDVQKFLESDQGRAQFKVMVEKTLIGKCRMLSEKIRQRQKLIDNININKEKYSALAISLYCKEIKNNEIPIKADSGVVDDREEPGSAARLLKLKELGKFLEESDSAHGRDQGDLELTLWRLKQISSGQGCGLPELGSALECAEGARAISEFIHQRLDTQIRKARGVLFESQLEGSRLRDRQFFHSERIEI